MRDYLLQLLARLNASEEGQGVYIGGGTLLLILIIVLLIILL